MYVCVCLHTYTNMLAGKKIQVCSVLKEFSLMKLLQAAWLLRPPKKTSIEIREDLVTSRISHSPTVPSKRWGSMSTFAKDGIWGLASKVQP